MSAELPKIQIVTNLSGTGYAIAGWDQFVEWANRSDALWHYATAIGHKHCLQEQDVIKLAAYVLMNERHQEIQKKIKSAIEQPLPTVVRF